MNSKRFKERFKDKSSYVTRNGRLTITPENFIPKFPMFSTQCHSYDDYLNNSDSSLKTNMTPTPVSQKNFQHFNHSPDIFCQESQHKMQLIKLTGYKPSSQFVIKKTHSFVEKRENDQEYHLKNTQERYGKMPSRKSGDREYNTSHRNKRLWVPANGILEKKKTYSGQTFARHESGFRMTPNEMYIKEWTYK